jgi:hypothetical protein
MLITDQRLSSLICQQTILNLWYTVLTIYTTHFYCPESLHFAPLYIYVLYDSQNMQLIFS